MKKKIITILLACCMAVSAGSSIPAAEDETEAPTESSASNDTETPKEPEIVASKYLTITDEKYKDIEVSVAPKEEVTDEDVDSEILYEASYYGLGKQITEGTVKEGDTVNIDYVGKKDGVAFDGGTAQDQSLEIGSDTFIDGFEDGLVGKKVGDTVDLNLKFPDDYGADDLAGQDVVFTVTINYIEGEPELNDDLADEMTGGECKTLDDLRKEVRKSLEQSGEAEYKSELYYQIFLKLQELYPISDYPQEWIDYYVDSQMATYQAQAEDETESLDDYLSSALGMTADNAKDYFTQTAEGLLQERIIIGAVAEKENITLSNEEFQKILEEHADEYGVGVDEFLAYYNQNGYSEEDVRMGELENKVLEYLAGVVKITEAEETEDDEAFIDWTEDTEAETETEE